MPNPISKLEFISIMAMMFATIAFSIDAMLPALPDIGQELSPNALNRAQLILTSFIFGMGVGTFVTGPLSDSFGRKPVVLAGALIYTLAAFVAWISSSLEVMLIARVFQGLGSAGPRVVAVAIVRDLYSGREMARMMSFIMMVFTFVPAVAPLLGAYIIDLSSWRGIFVAFIVFSTLSTSWFFVRITEPLPIEKRRPFNVAAFWSATKEIFANPTVRLSIYVTTLCMTCLFAMISTVHPIYEITFDKAESFPRWFAGVALVSGTASLLNAALVIRHGMRKIVTYVLLMQIIFSALMVALWSIGIDQTLYFAIFVIWQISVFAMIGMTLGNLNAMALDPLGHIAGFAASITAGVSTVLSAVFAGLIGQAFGGTPLPLALGICACCIIGFMIMLRIKQIEARLGR